MHVRLCSKADRNEETPHPAVRQRTGGGELFPSHRASPRDVGFPHYRDAPCSFPRAHCVRERWPLPDGERRLDYYQFKDLVREAGERHLAKGGLVAIPDLRRQVPALDRKAFDDFVLTLHRE